MSELRALLQDNEEGEAQVAPSETNMVGWSSLFLAEDPPNVVISYNTIPFNSVTIELVICFNDYLLVHIHKLC